MKVVVASRGLESHRRVACNRHATNKSLIRLDHSEAAHHLGTPSRGHARSWCREGSGGMGSASRRAKAAGGLPDSMTLEGPIGHGQQIDPNVADFATMMFRSITTPSGPLVLCSHAFLKLHCHLPRRVKLQRLDRMLARRWHSPNPRNSTGVGGRVRRAVEGAARGHGHGANCGD